MQLGCSGMESSEEPHTHPQGFNTADDNFLNKAVCKYLISLLHSQKGYIQSTLRRRRWLALAAHRLKQMVREERRRERGEQRYYKYHELHVVTAPVPKQSIFSASSSAASCALPRETQRLACPAHEETFSPNQLLQYVRRNFSSFA